MTKQHSIRHLCAVLLASLILFACTGIQPGAARAAESEKKLTVILYMCGSNLESDNGAATADITEILRSRYNTEAVNVVAMLGGTRKWWGGMDAEETAVYEIGGNRPKQVWSDGLMNMGDPATLSTLLNYSCENYPAQEYALVLWNHGGGPMGGVCWDELSKSDNLTMEELQTALDESPFADNPLEWIGFDACLMSSVETAHLMAPYARYMIASQETEPGTGWSYSFLSGIEEDADGAATGKRIIDTYMEATPVRDGLTLSCTDLSKIADVEDCMDAFFEELSVDLTEDTFSALSNMRQDAHGYGRSDNASSDLDLVDLKDLVAHYADQSPENAAALEDAINEAVVFSQSTEPNSNGLSVYHPYYNKALYQEKGEEEYTGFFFSPGYTQYIQRFTALWLGEALTDWSKLAPAEEVFSDDNQALFSFQLNEEQQANFASAQLIVLEQYGIPDHEGNFVYTQVYASSDVSLDENGVLTASYNGRTLYCLDENGDPMTGTIHYLVDGEYTVVPANFINDEDGTLYHTLLYCTVDEATDDLVIQNIYVYDEASQQYTNRLTINPDEFHTVYFPRSYFYPTYDGDTFLAYVDWDKNENMYIANGFDNYYGSWHFHFYNEQLTGTQLYATFQVVDTQANTYSTELKQVINPNVKEEAVEPSELSSDNYQMQFSAVLKSSELYPGLSLRVQITNPTDRELSYRIENIRLNGNRAVDSTLYSSLKGGETDLRSVTFSATDLSNIDRVTSIEGDLVIRDGESAEVLEKIPVSFAMDVEVTGISSVSDTENVLAQTQTDNMEIQLLSVTEDTAGALSMELHVTNLSDEDAELSLDQVAVNGYGMLNYEEISVDAGQDTYETIEYDSDIYYYEYFDHAGGSNQLTRHSPLSWYGVTEITDISLIADETRADLVLDEPVPYEQKPTDDPAQKVLIYEKGDVEINLEQAWVIDHDVVLALECINKGSSNTNLEFRDPAYDGTSVGFNWYGNQTVKTWAGTTTREYLHLKVPEDSEYSPEDVSQISFSIRSEADNGAIIFDKILIDFNDPAPFEADDGVLINAEDLTVSTADYFESDTSGPVILSEVTTPEDVSSYAKEVTLPLSEEQRNELTGATATLVAEYDNAEFQLEDGSTAEGKIILSLERTELDISSGETASGTLQGLYLSSETAEGEDVPVMMETKPEETGFSFAPVNDIRLYMAESFSDLLLFPSITFTGSVNKQENTAALEGIHISAPSGENDGQDACTDWPVSGFQSYEIFAPQMEIVEDESGNWSYSSNAWDPYRNIELTGTIRLALKPAETLPEAGNVKSLGVIYQLYYKDGTSTLTDIYPW